jgi:hypothetical protein
MITAREVLVGAHRAARLGVAVHKDREGALDPCAR